MIDAKRHVPLLDAFIAWAARMLEANEAAIREMVHARTGWLLRLAGLDDTIADKIVEGMAKLFEEMATDPGHPVRARAEQRLASLAAVLQTDPATRARVARVKRELDDKPAVGQYAGRSACRERGRKKI